MLLSQITFSQSKREIDYIKNLPYFSIYGDNYMVTGTSLKSDWFQPRTSDVKFEIGFKQRLTNINVWGVFPFISYRQKSFWNVYLESLPFRETNYNPAIGFVKLFANERGITDLFWLAFEHESNGRDRRESRSWNFASLTYLKPIGRKWQVRSKFWIPFGRMSDNQDITSYRGFFSLGVSYNPIKNTYFDVHVQPALSRKLRGFVKLGVSFKILEKNNEYFYIQYFGGYSEDLINYNQSVSKLRVGIVFKDLLANFSGK